MHLAVDFAPLTAALVIHFIFHNAFSYRVFALD